MRYDEIFQDVVNTIVNDYAGFEEKQVYHDAFYFVKKQAVGFVLGLVAMLVCARFDYQILKGKRLRWVALIVPMVLLALVFVPGIGKTNYGATRWIGFGGLTIQPSELAKYGFVIFSAAYMSDNIGKMRALKGVFPVLLAGAGICLLIIFASRKKSINR